MLAGKDPEKTSNERLMKLVKELSTDLNNKVYSAEGKSVIEETRAVLDLTSLALKLKEHGASPVNVFPVEYQKFKKAVDTVPVDSVKQVPEEELKHQFKLYLQKLQAMTAEIDKPELTSTDSKELIKQFIDPAGELFKDVEMVMQAIAVCAVKHSCESVLESFVSRYENHFDSRRNTEEDATNEEFEVAVNEPILANCGAVVKEAMDDYWSSRGGRWHFYRRSGVEKLKAFKGNSEVMNRMMETPNHLPFMN